MGTVSTLRNIIGEEPELFFTAEDNKIIDRMAKIARDTDDWSGRLWVLGDDFNKVVSTSTSLNQSVRVEAIADRVGLSRRHLVKSGLTAQRYPAKDRIPGLAWSVFDQIGQEYDEDAPRQLLRILRDEFGGDVKRMTVTAVRQVLGRAPGNTGAAFVDKVAMFERYFVKELENPRAWTVKEQNALRSLANQIMIALGDRKRAVS